MTRIAEMVAAQTEYLTKEMLNTAEAARFIGVSKKYLYLLMMRKKIPHYKPNGKMCYFSRKELETWLTANRVATSQELNDKAARMARKPIGGGRGL